MVVTPVRVLVLSIIALAVGALLTRRIAALKRFSIPVAVTGGLLFASAFSLIEAVWGVRFDWDLSVRDTLLLVFFSGVGTSAKWSRLKGGGRVFVRLAMITVAFRVVQNLVGIGVALAVGRNPEYGLVCGSIAFAGGHGTAITWGKVAAEMGYSHILSHGIAFATFGLIAGGILGGPIAHRLIRKHNLVPSAPGSRVRAPRRVPKRAWK